MICTIYSVKKDTPSGVERWNEIFVIYKTKQKAAVYVASDVQ